MPWWKEQDDFDATQDIDPDKEYTGWQLEKLTDELLRQDTKTEMCRSCGERGQETGVVENLPQADENGVPATDKEGDTLFISYPELKCKNGHRWYKGEGKARGIDGDNPILFENHLRERQRREIYTEQGTPDPNLVSGIYNRSHPQGRKVNSEEQRKKHGASWYR